MAVRPLPPPGPDREALVAEVGQRLRAGEVVVLPTDTVYGLVALAADAAALDRVREAKGRPAEVPIAVLVADPAQGLALAADAPPAVAALVERWWPGPLTLVLRAGPAAPDVGGAGTIGVRCPDDDLLRALAQAVGPLAATSANRHGEPTPSTAEAVSAALPGLLVVDGGSRGDVASTVVDACALPVRVLREGVVPAAAVHEAAAG